MTSESMDHVVEDLITRATDATNAFPQDIDLLKTLLADVVGMMKTNIYLNSDLILQDQLKRVKKNLVSDIESNEKKQQEEAKQESNGREEEFAEESNDSENFYEESHQNIDLEDLMDRGTAAFYKGNYPDAIRYYEQALKLDPGRQRAIKNMEIAEEYLKSGDRPEETLPGEVGTNYGKAKSALEAGFLDKAQGFLDKSLLEMKAAGIPNWKGGRELGKRIENEKNADELFLQGENKIKAGKWDEGIGDIKRAYGMSPVPLYAKKAKDAEDDLETLNRVSLSLNAREATIIEKLAAIDSLNMLEERYQGNNKITSLGIKKGRANEEIDLWLIDDVNTSIKQAEEAKSIAAGRIALDDASKKIKKLKKRNIKLYAPIIENKYDTINGKIIENESLLQIAQESKNFLRFLTNRGILNDNYSTDEKVQGLDRRFGLIKIIFYTLSIILLIAVGNFGFKEVKDYKLSLIPTNTPTPLPTSTPTSTPSPTPPNTATPIPTNTFTPVPTPMVLTTTRGLFLRDGCYEGYLSNGWVPTNTVLYVVTTDVQVDNINRTCIFVNFKGEEDIYGWALSSDLIPID